MVGASLKGTMTVEDRNWYCGMRNPTTEAYGQPPVAPVGALAVMPVGPTASTVSTSSLMNSTMAVLAMGGRAWLYRSPVAGSAQLAPIGVEAWRVSLPTSPAVPVAAGPVYGKKAEKPEAENPVARCRAGT